MVRLGRSKWDGVICAKDAKAAPVLIEEGMKLLLQRVRSSQDGPVGISRALSILHTQNNLV